MKDLMEGGTDQDFDVAIEDDDLINELVTVDTILSQSLLKGDPTAAFQYIRDVRSLGIRKSMGVARILYQTWVDWPLYQKAGIDDDWENVAPGMSGLSLDHCRRYRDIVANIHENPEIPEGIRKAIMRKPVQSQFALMTAARDGDLDEDDWNAVINASSPTEVSAIVREKRGARTSSESRIIVVEERGGTLKAKQGVNGRYVNVARLLNSREDTEGDGYEQRVRSIVLDKMRRGTGALRQ